MATTVIQNVVFDAEGNPIRKVELLISDASDLAGAPPCAPGSVAYTADLSYMAMWDGAEWVQMGGGGSEEASGGE